jgi:hypothetical protein
MNLVDQRLEDDCLVACLATYFDLPYEEVPHFVQTHEAMWSEALRRWLNDRGYEVVCFDNHYPRRGLYMADGWTSRETPHVTLWRGVNMIHDPHPSRSGLTNIRRTYWLMPLEHTESGR